MTAPHRPEEAASSKSGVKSGETPSTDATRKPDRPVEEEDVFGGAERVSKNDADVDRAKP